MTPYLITETGLFDLKALNHAIELKYGSVQLMEAQLRHDDDEDRNPVGYELMGNVGVISVNGTTCTESSWLTRYFSMPSYDDIKQRFAEASADGSKVIVLKPNTPGGAAIGVGALSEFISLFNTKVKPVVTHTSGQMCSAAVWYGTAGSLTLSDRDADIGSVGAVNVYSSSFRMYEQMGIDNEVIRSAPLKAFPSGIEAISKKGKEVLQERVDVWGNRFITGLSENLGIPAEKVKNTIASGKVFTAQQALSLGLINKIIPFEQLIANLNSKYDNKPVTAPRP